MTAKKSDDTESTKTTTKKSSASPKKSAAKTEGTLRITLVRSVIGRPPDQEATVRTLGLRRLHQTVERPDTPDVRGMVTKIRHLVTVEEAAS